MPPHHVRVPGPRGWRGWSGGGGSESGVCWFFDYFFVPNGFPLLLCTSFSRVSALCCPKYVQYRVRCRGDHWAAETRPDCCGGDPLQLQRP